MEFNKEKLAYFNGKEGRPAYVAIENVVYDVTEYASWAEGMHFGILAGIDTTEEFDACHKRTFLENLTIVGKLVE